MRKLIQFLLTPFQLVRSGIFSIVLPLKAESVASGIREAPRNSPFFDPTSMEDPIRLHARTMVAWLRPKLQRMPRWTTGHLAFSKFSIEDGDIASAYASANAALVLARSGRKRAQAELILAKCYVRRGSYEEAISVLERLRSESTAEILEELAAAYMGIGDLPKADAILAMIPEGQRTAGGSAALSFTKERR